MLDLTWSQLDSFFLPFWAMYGAFGGQGGVEERRRPGPTVYLPQPIAHRMLFRKFRNLAEQTTARLNQPSRRHFALP